jgi:hypothetical protein
MTPMTSTRSHRFVSLVRGGLVAVALMILSAPLQSVFAQTPILSAAVDGYTATGLGASIPQAEFVPITVTRNDGPLHMQASGEGGDFFTGCTIPCVYAPSVTHTYAGGYASADPGVLRIYAADIVEALPEFNAPNVPGTQNGHTVYANISASAGFTVYLTVGSTTQPAGTPVQVPFHYAAEMVAGSDLAYPPYSVHPLSAFVNFSFPGLGAQILSTDNCHIGFCGFTTTPQPSGNTLYTVRSIEFFVSAKVGDVLPISASIGLNGSPRIVNSNNANGGGNNVLGNWADGRNTAGIWYGTLPSGMTITSSDGHDYSIDPTLHGAPVAPAQVTATATAGDARAFLSFAAPLGTGASAITGYTVTSSPGGITATGPTSPIVLLGLTNGTAYTFTVTSKNAAGLSTVSAASNSVTPDASLAPAPPSAPVIGVATAGDTQAIVSFTAPAGNGGSPITGYTVTASPGGVTATGAASPITVAGLTNGTAYTFTVTARTVIGVSTASAQSNSVTPMGLVAPTPPSIGVATAGDARATISFTAPGSDGGSPISSYRVTASPGGLFATGATSPITVPGLTNGTAYTFTVMASNSVGESLPSAASNSVTPAVASAPPPPSIPVPASIGGGGSFSISLLLALSLLQWSRRCVRARPMEQQKAWRSSTPFGATSIWPRTGTRGR